MEWNDPITTHLLDFLFELENHGLTTPLTIVGGFGLFIKKRYLVDQKERTLFVVHEARSTEDIDICVPVDILCSEEQSQAIRATLHCLQYEVVDSAMYMQWKKRVELGQIKIDFLTGNVDAYREHLKKSSTRPQQNGRRFSRTPYARSIIC